MPQKKDPSVSFSESGAGQKGISASQEEDARQMIDMLRGDDVSGRIAAANKLESVAAALGEERTREVSFMLILLKLESSSFHVSGTGEGCFLFMQYMALTKCQSARATARRDNPQMIPNHFST
uniref:Uncharacterized protein n=1 Tax=Ditylum brightwellii TaxID=49249 RepID=A0A7S4QJU1_9STRA